jgi:hypothetical protein
MQFTRTIQGNPHKKMIVSQKSAPGRREQSSIGLNGIADALFRRTESFLQFNHTLKEFHSKQCRLTALPGETNLLRRFCRNILLNVVFKRLPVHAEISGFVVIRKKCFLLEVKAIFAIQITYWTNGLGENVKWQLRGHKHLINSVRAAEQKTVFYFSWIQR